VGQASLRGVPARDVHRSLHRHGPTRTRSSRCATSSASRWRPRHLRSSLQLQGAGTAGDNTLEGNEEALPPTTTRSSSISFATRFARGQDVRAARPVQRSSGVDGRPEGLVGRRLDTWFFNQAAASPRRPMFAIPGCRRSSPRTRRISSGRTARRRRVAHDRRRVQLGAYRSHGRACQDVQLGGRRRGAVPADPLQRRRLLRHVHPPFQTFSLRTNYNAGAWADLQKSQASRG
jgi:hypothetical protein